MYQFSSKLKTAAFALMIIGALGIGWGFLSAPSTVEEAKEIVAHSNDGHHGGVGSADAHADSHADEHHDASHDVHTLHQLQNRPWSAVYVGIFFFMMIALGVLAFYAIQHVAQAGWSIVLFRVMEGITAYLPIGAVILFAFLVLSSLHMNHVFAWMDPALVDPDSPTFDHLLYDKKGYLNVPFFLIRSAIYIAGWLWYRHYTKKQSLKLDAAAEGDLTHYKKTFKASAIFLVFFLVSESMMSWDWLMSIDHHWFSTLYGWYVFAGMFVCGITTIAMITIYLKSKGLLEYVNDSHIHDLAKFMFGFSVFWTYLWFSQFMLIWYADIPEEVTYYVQRFEEVKVPFLTMVAMNFAFPVLLLMNSDYKRLPWFVVMGGIVILLGHYIDVYLLITPGSVGAQWKFLSVEVIGSMLFFLGLFIFVVFTALSKSPLKVKGNPFMKESENYHY
ncbi:MAG: quinol:cytochrome C oxidoreductase [Bacteroidetes bacterium MedPE-SWsnd-G1]|nr:MAG: quinol:cytochrome C oxidoreductase [Bacteroidetes bacterium MedPE-SWsnd-G1]